MATKRLHKTWWGGAFMQALEAYIDSGRLQRGKAYRTDNRVLDFDISASEIKATIRGNINPYFGVTKEPRYKVHLKFEQIKPLQWQRIIKKISGNALWLSKLMLNEIPVNIEDAFEDEHLLPASYRNIKASCSCPDYSDPCKHIAGVYYRIANILDSNPMLLFQLRGLAPAKLHKELKKTELGQAFSEHLSLPESIEMEYQQHKYTPTYARRDKGSLAQKGAQPIMHQAANLNQFWSMPLNVKPVDDQGDDVEGLDIERAQGAAQNVWPLEHPSNDSMIEISAALIKKQGDYPEFWTNSHSFIGAMELFYSHT
ncbi:MAG: putative Zn finger protein, partial [Paraglaciecola sp.]